MLRELFTSVGRIYNFLIMLVVAVILGFTTWAYWEIYQEALLQREFVKEGKLVSVIISQADHTQRSWRDILGNSVYLTVEYKGNHYTTRYVRDTTYVSTGDRVQLLYHPRYDAFRQPGDEIHFDQSKRTSRLIDWTAIRFFSNENRLLFLCLLLSIGTFFVIAGVINTVLPVPFLQSLARFVFVTTLFAAAVFFTYDTWRYYQYYQHLKTDGQQVSVRVLDTDRKARFRQSSRTFYKLYDYDATIRYQQQERVIPISEDDFETLKPNDSLNVFYDEAVDDFMSVDYSLTYSQILLPAFFWLLAFILLRPGFTRTKKSRV
ncbi:hypothetical protein BH09BAC4_BH09BAC4_29880 [soil metagenome]